MRQKRPLTRFEILAQQLVEGSFKRLFGERLAPQEVAVRLARAMEDSHQANRVADWYVVELNPDDLSALLAASPDLAAEMSDYLIRLGQQTNLTFVARPQVALVAEPMLGHHQMRIEAAHREIVEEESTQVQPRADAAAVDLAAAVQAIDAYLIVAGRQHVPLDRPLITIGRQMDNDIVLDAATVSRRHAQIRWRYGRFILYNLSRRGRTLVNDQLVSEHVLQPGDVIALSTTRLIYGEGLDEGDRGAPAADDGLTRQLPPRDQ